MISADPPAGTSVPVRYRCLWTPFDGEMRDAMLRPTPGPVYYDGPEVEALETEAAAYLGVARGIGVSSGTTALHLAMLAMGIGPGDEVVCAANGYLSGPECAIHAGATPVYCDVLDTTANMDAQTVEPVLSPRTKAIVAVHLYGHPVDMDPLMDLRGGGASLSSRISRTRSADATRGARWARSGTPASLASRERA